MDKKDTQTSTPSTSQKLEMIQKKNLKVIENRIISLQSMHEMTLRSLKEIINVHKNKLGVELSRKIYDLKQQKKKAVEDLIVQTAKTSTTNNIKSGEKDIETLGELIKLVEKKFDDKISDVKAMIKENKKILEERISRKILEEKRTFQNSMQILQKLLLDQKKRTEISQQRMLEKTILCNIKKEKLQNHKKPSNIIKI